MAASQLMCDPLHYILGFCHGCSEVWWEIMLVFVAVDSPFLKLRSFHGHCCRGTLLAIHRQPRHTEYRAISHTCPWDDTAHVIAGPVLPFFLGGGGGQAMINCRSLLTRRQSRNLSESRPTSRLAEQYHGKNAQKCAGLMWITWWPGMFCPCVTTSISIVKSTLQNSWPRVD